MTPHARIHKRSEPDSLKGDSEVDRFCLVCMGV
ncbi:hypothetical protein ALP21_200036 [Pseudomonas savastanoi pv. phaseolicola]|uniref:Uncharacterized protein n=1 Tax=Pseudomonas savastanoi pv. phaseolicola TaxID=319 RepID=A0A7Z6UUL0_PSESH|nr:hypothetical protein ALP21_200036 [Pseudomonas savastanoi pv. phaseolicola]